MSVLLRHQLLLGLIAGLVFFTNLGGYALFDDDEPKNAVCGREMFERGDWIVPTFNGALRTDKPILIYWWMHLSYWCFGVSEFSARLGSAVFASCSVLMTYHLGRKLYCPSVGLLAGIILATSFMFSAVGRAATPDSTLIFCLMLAFTGYVRAVASRRGGHFSGTPDPHSGSSETWRELVPATALSAMPMYAAMGLSILAKGPIGIVLPCMVIGTLLLVTMHGNVLATGRSSSTESTWWRRSILPWLRCLHPIQIAGVCRGMHLLPGIVMALVVACPWYALVGWHTQGAWLAGFLGDHNVARFLAAKEGHRGPVFYYLIVLFFGCFPWSGFLPLAAWRLRHRLKAGDAWSDSDRFVSCWLVVWLVFFSLASTKLPNYVLPMYPAMALLMARYLSEWRYAGLEWGTHVFRNFCRIYAVVGIVAMIAIPIATTILLNGGQWLMIIGAVPLAGATAAYAAAVREHRTRAMQILSMTAIMLTVLSIGIAPTSLRMDQECARLAAAAQQACGKPHPRIAVVDGFSPSLVFYAGHTIPQVGVVDAMRFCRKDPGSFLVTRSDRVEPLQTKGLRFVEVSRCRRLFRRYDLVLLRRSDSMASGTEPIVR